MGDLGSVVDESRPEFPAGIATLAQRSITQIIPPTLQNSSQSALGNKTGKMVLVASAMIFLLTVGGSVLFIFYPMGTIIIMKPLTVSFVATASSGLFISLTLLVIGCLYYKKVISRPLTTSSGRFH